MVSCRPGNYVLYSAPHRPPWPAVMVANEMVPKALRKNRLAGYEVPIFLLQKSELRWVGVGDLQEYGDYVLPDDLANKHPGLRDAHNSYFNAIADDLDLSYWRHVIALEYEEAAIPLEEKEDREEPDSEDSDQDSDFQRAICASLIDQPDGKRLAAGLDDDDVGATVPESALKRRKTSAAALTEPFRERNTPSSPYGHPTVGLVSRGVQTPPDFLTQDGDDEQDTTRRRPLEKPSLTVEYGDQNMEHFGTPYPTPPVEGDEGEDELLDPALACWRIGPDQTPFYIPKTAVTQRPHLVRMEVLIPDGKHGWRVIKPSFENIDPVNFGPVAQFLSDGDFKVSKNDEDWKSKAMEIYAGAWEVAEDLVLDDMMQLMVEKMKAMQPWPLLETLIFASTVYSELYLTAYAVPAAKDMKDLLSGYIADNFWIYLSDYSVIFRERLGKYPELRRDVYRMMAKEAEEELELQQD